MKVEQYVMAYSVEQDRLRAILPDGFISLRPVLRINAEIRDGREGYLELNTAVSKDGNRGWLNVGHWHDVPFERDGKTVIFQTGFVEISFTRAGITGSCPAEQDNAGCYFLDQKPSLRLPEAIDANKEFCDCAFRWNFTEHDAHGKSIGKTLPAYAVEASNRYPKEDFTVENAVKIPCEQVLGTYAVQFARDKEQNLWLKNSHTSAVKEML